MTTILLVGMMGSGKTTLGEILSSRLGFEYFDSDSEVAAQTGHSVSEIFEANGEEAFRRAEKEALRHSLGKANLRKGPSLVVSVAGGAVLDQENRELLKTSGMVVWLRASPETLAKRLGNGDGRPLLKGGNVADILLKLDAVRRPLYESVADVVIDADTLEPTALADIVIDAVVPEKDLA